MKSVHPSWRDVVEAMDEFAAPAGREVEKFRRVPCFSEKTGAPILRVKNVSKTFGGVVCALDEVSLEVYPNEIVGVVGENGAGKTTLMKILVGIHMPDRGEWEHNGVMVPFPRNPKFIGHASAASSMRAIFHAPGEHVVAFVPVAGPVPPPIMVVIPLDSAS